MKSRFLALLFALVCLVPLARGQDDPNAKDRATIFSGDSQETILLKHIWRRLGGPGDTSAGSGTGGTPGVALANPSTTPYRNANGSSTPLLVKTGAGMIYGCNYINPNASPVYVKYYDSAAPTVGTTIPLQTILVPANGAYNIVRNGFPHGAFTTAISLAVVTGIADNNTTAPATPILIQLAYQ